MESRKRTRQSSSAGFNTQQGGASNGGLFFRDTRQLQDEGENGDDGDHLFVRQSDADEDEDDYEETPRPTKKRQASKRSSKKKASKRTAIEKVLEESEYDSEDKLILELKGQGHKDAFVAAKLAEKSGRKLVEKTIATRWLKLKKKETEKEERRLDDELSDWHIGEDEKLRACFNESEATFEVELLKLKEKKWTDISASMAEVLGVKKYTAKACKERWESLEDGSGLLPIELDDDKEGRYAIRQARYADNMRRREEEKAALIWQLGAKDREAAKKRAIAAEKEAEREAERARKQAERDEDDRIKAEARAGLEKKRAEQRAVADGLKRAFEAKREERKNADAMYVHYTGKKLNGRRDNDLIKTRDDDDSASYYSDSDVEMKDSKFGDGAGQDSQMRDASDGDEDSGDDGAASRTARSTGTAKSKVKRTNRIKKPKVTLQTLTNPRSIMSSAELDEVLARRNLRRRGRDETHAEVVARLAAADAEETIPKIRELLAAHFDRKKGSREVLTRRLQEYDAAHSELGLQGMTADVPEFKRGYEGYLGRFAYALDEEEVGAGRV